MPGHILMSIKLTGAHNLIKSSSEEEKIVVCKLIKGEGLGPCKNLENTRVEDKE